MNRPDPNGLLPNLLPIAEALPLLSGRVVASLADPPNGQEWVVAVRDLARMHDMGLGHLPVEAASQRTPLPTQGLLATPTPVVNSPPDGPLQPVVLNVARRLSDYFPKKFVTALYELQSLFRRHAIKGYVIGGIARDLVRAEEGPLAVQDVDITVEGDAVALVNWVASASSNFTLLETYPEFGTAKLRYKDVVTLDFASTRKERYPHCGALPQVTERGVPLAEDLMRRDFTINTLALSIHNLGEVLDYTGGVADIQQRQLRVLHAASFYEDPSRILRAYKFATRFGFQLDANTAHLVRQFLHYADSAGYRAGGSRIRHALQEWLLLPETDTKRYWIRQWLQEGGWRLVMPSSSYCEEGLVPVALQWLERFWLHWPQVVAAFRLREDDLEDGAEDEADDEEASPYWLWSTYLCYLLGTLCRDAALDLAELRLELPREEREIVGDFMALRQPEATWLTRLSHHPSALAVVETLEPYAPEAVFAAMAQHTHVSQLLPLLQQYLTVWRQIQPELKGDDLITLGVPQTAQLGKLLKALRRKRLEGSITTRSQEIDFIQQQLGQ